MASWIIQITVMVLSVFTSSSQGKRDKQLYCSGKSPVIEDRKCIYHLVILKYENRGLAILRSDKAESLWIGVQTLVVVKEDPAVHW